MKIHKIMSAVALSAVLVVNSMSAAQLWARAGQYIASGAPKLKAGIPVAIDYVVGKSKMLFPGLLLGSAVVVGADQLNGQAPEAPAQPEQPKVDLSPEALFAKAQKDLAGAEQSTGSIVWNAFRNNRFVKPVVDEAVKHPYIVGAIVALGLGYKMYSRSADKSARFYEATGTPTKGVNEEAVILIASYSRNNDTLVLKSGEIINLTRSWVKTVNITNDKTHVNTGCGFRTLDGNVAYLTKEEVTDVLGRRPNLYDALKKNAVLASAFNFPKPVAVEPVVKK